MKKLIFLFLLLVPTLVFGDDFYSCHDLYDYSLWVNRNISYKSETRDYQQTYKETLSLKTGDCDDFAVLNYAWLIRHNYTSTIYFIVVAEGGHMITVFKKGYRSWIFSNNNLIPTELDTDIDAIINTFKDVELVAKQTKIIYGYLDGWKRTRSRKVIWRKK